MLRPSKSELQRLKIQFISIMEIKRNFLTTKCGHLHDFRLCKEDQFYRYYETIVVYKTNIYQIGFHIENLIFDCFPSDIIRNNLMQTKWTYSIDGRNMLNEFQLCDFIIEVCVQLFFLKFLPTNYKLKCANTNQVYVIVHKVNNGNTMRKKIAF